MTDIVQATIGFVQSHRDWAAPIVFALAFCESFAFISLVVPATVILFAVGGLIGASGTRILVNLARRSSRRNRRRLARLRACDEVRGQNRAHVAIVARSGIGEARHSVFRALGHVLGVHRSILWPTSRSRPDCRRPLSNAVVQIPVEQRRVGAFMGHRNSRAWSNGYAMAYGLKRFDLSAEIGGRAC